MKSRTLFQCERIRWYWASLLGLCVGVPNLLAADAPAAEPADAKAPEEAKAEAAEAEAPAPLTPEQMFEGGAETYSNWIELSGGGFITSGDKSELQRRRQTSGDGFGGIEDFHYQGEVTKGTTLAVDGRALFDLNDYRLKLDLTREKLGYLRFSYKESRTWYNGDGGFYPPSGLWYSLGDEALELDRGEVSFEGGLTLDKLPKITFGYTHTFRDGRKDSTIWGPTHPTGGILTRSLSPSFYDIDEHSDAFRLDVTHHIKATDFGVGLRYETGELDNALKITEFPREAIQQRITDKQGTSYDLFNVHAFSETWIKKNLLFSSGYSFTDLDNDFSGSRIYGQDFDVGYSPGAQNGFGYFGLNGGSQMQEHVLNLNLMAVPMKHFTITPSIRVQKEDADADSSGLETLGLNTAVPFTANSDRGILDVRERLDLRYTGVTNWVFYARPEFTQGDGNLKENGGLGPVGGVGTAPVQRKTDDERFFQKYSAGARWYPDRRVSVDAGGYYKLNSYDYDHNLDSTANDGVNRYPAYLEMQDFETYDGNVRLTLRPLRNVTSVSRYEYQYSTINTKPDSISGLGEVETSTMTSHILGQDLSWTPWSRLHLQVGFNYVLSETQTPASEVTEAILDFQNNYWTVNFSPTLVLDDRTDLKVSYFYYRADNYDNNSEFGVPLGAGEDEHGVTATITRRINKNLRLMLRYGYFHYEDETYGGNKDFNSHLVYTSLQYRF